ncbi:MAG TPA: class I SAM-dependent methyltransferase [Paludibaculum sp.]
MFEDLERIHGRPEPFEFYTAADLWIDEYTSAQMLSLHLNGAVDVSSRNTQFIQRSIEWIVSRFRIGKETKIADFGCGPGLYANELARRGAHVTGIDFSRRSIEYAKAVAAREQLDVRYVTQNYLDFETDDRFDLVLLIMCDFCALSPVQRKVLLKKFHGILKPGGAVLTDVYSMVAFDQREEGSKYEVSASGGFWAPGKYFCFQSTFKYVAASVVLDKYTIVEPERTRTVFNWLQYFSAEELTREFLENGLLVQEFLSDVAGAPHDPGASEFAVIATR